ncbi:MAG: sulfurtransferase TusA family protein [Elusimicrobia bacterium]|nr:sulfurtransferase TusA family protein [Elusimicrobiota bacterium]
MEHSLEPVKSLDVRWLICPFHRLKVLRALDEINSGEILEVLLEGGEPLGCISLEVKKLGHHLLRTEKIKETSKMEEMPENIMIWIRKK